jgi:tetratricopeptide (TPR) repeat protein
MTKLKRSAARCFMHVGEPDRGVQILNKSGICAIDPWIASAEIAISQGSGLKSKCIGKAKDLIGDDNLTPFSRSELAVSLGTAEIKSGSTGRGKKFMRYGIIDPTENALAQIEWAASFFKIDFDDVFESRSGVPASYEATAVHEYYSRKFTESLEAYKKWGRFQFLSSRPIIDSMFISSVILNDDVGAIGIFEDALPVQKDSPLAINNYAFALARMDRTEEARDIIRKGVTGASREEMLVLGATEGLICFREGDKVRGRILYNGAIKGFELLQDYHTAARGIYFWANEEKRINSEFAEEKIKEAKKRIKQHNVFELEELAKKL